MLGYLFCNPALSCLFSNSGSVDLFCTLYVIKSLEVTLSAGISLISCITYVVLLCTVFIKDKCQDSVTKPATVSYTV